MNKWVLLSIFFYVIGFAGLIILLAVYLSVVPEEYAHGIMFDAGSTKTRMYVYRWPTSKTNNTGIVHQITSCLVEGGGLSEYATNPERAGPSLQACLNQAKVVVPTRLAKSTPVYLGATAGMRVLSQTNAIAAQQILVSVRTMLESSGFMVSDLADQVRIITGQEEGVGGWVTVNYVLGSLGRSFKSGTWQLSATASKTVGSLDLGGASTQIVFVDENPSKTPRNYSKEVVLYAYDYQLYSYSFLCYGLNEAVGKHYAQLAAASSSAIVEDPCFPLGYSTNFSSASLFSSFCTSSMRPTNAVPVYTFRGTGNTSQCVDSIKRLFDLKSCTFWNCSFNGVFMPLAGGGAFAAFSGYYYVTGDLGFFNSSSPSAILTSGQFLDATNVWCTKPWSQYNGTDVKLCARANYVYALLTDGYKFSDTAWKSVLFSNSANGTDFGWALGYMLNQTNVIASKMESSRLSIDPLPFVFLTVLAVLLCFLAALFTFLAYRTHNRRGCYMRV